MQTETAAKRDWNRQKARIMRAFLLDAGEGS